MAERTESVILDFEVDEGASIETIQSLTKANKELREERNRLNISTEAGKKKAQEINAVIDQNTAKIKTNVSAIEKQRLNIGNYRADIEASVPAFGKFAKAQDTAGKAATALRLALGPIGIIVGLIVAAVGLLIKSFLGTQEGMDKVTSVTRPLLAIFDRLIGVLQELGGKVFKQLAEAVTNPIQAIKNLGNSIVELFKIAAEAVTNPLAFIQRLKNGVDTLVSFVDEAITQGQRLDELQKQIERGEIEQIKRSKELNLIIKQNKAIVEDETKSFKDRINAALGARVAQNAVLSDELNLLDKRIEKLKLQQSLNDTSREDEKELAELEAQRFDVQAANAEQSIEFDKKLTELRAKQKLALEEQIALERASRRAQGEGPEAGADPLIGAFETRAKIITDIDKRLGDDLAKRNRETELQIIRDKKKSAEIQEQVERDKAAIIGGFIGSIADLVAEDSAERKILASAQAIINTYLAATAALASGSEINPIFGIISAAAAIASGLASVAKINGVEFAEGGWTGPGEKYKAVGIVHADEYVTPKRVKNLPQAQPHLAALEGMRLRGYADGGLVTNSVSTPINQQLELMNIVKNMPAPVVGVKEVTKMQRRVQVKESISKR